MNWQPIDTAPMDVSLLLVWTVGDRAAVVVAYSDIFVDEHMWSYSSHELTHWASIDPPHGDA